MFAPLHYQEIDSTNKEALRLIQAGEISQKSVIYADRQTAGQGSRGRTWQSQKEGNFLATYILPLSAQEHPHYLTLYPISNACFQLMKDLLPEESVQIKWPNDLLVNEQKIAGMLHELTAHNGQDYFIAGIGINIAWCPSQADTHFPPTYLAELTSPRPSIETLVEKLGTYIEKELEIWTADPSETYINSILPNFYKLNEQISVHLAHDRTNKISGTFKAIDPSGALILETEDRIEKISAGDIFPTLHEKI